MDRPLLVGLTGGIGAGKTTIAAVFHCLGAPVYDSDSWARQLMTTDKAIVSEIKKAFGTKSYANGKLNRPYLASKVFSSDENQRVMNAIVHPEIIKHFQKWAKENSAASYIIKESALLSDSMPIKLDKYILVTAPEDLRIKRILARDNRTIEEIKNIMERQKQTIKADYSLLNDELQLLVPQIEELHKTFVKWREKYG